MIVGFIINLAVSLLLIVFGLLIWKKQKISLLHDYHYKNVKQESIPAYSRLIGIGLIIIGIGILITGVLNLVKSSLWWIPILSGFVFGLLVMNKAQKTAIRTRMIVLTRCLALIESVLLNS